jgi:hypothetical protein
MNASRKLPVVLGFIALAAVACFILYLTLGVEPAPQAVPQTEPEPEVAPARVPVPVPDPEPEPIPEPIAKPEPTPEPEPEPELVKPRPAPRPLKSVTAVKDDQPPRLKVTTPRNRSYVMARLLPVRARSEAGARVEVNDKPLKELSAGVFSGSVQLKPGDNRLEFSAKDAVGNTSSAAVRVTFVAPKRIRKVKTRFTSLLDQLEEVRDLANAETVNRLSRELREIRNARRDLQKEIEKAIGEIDELLEKHQ